MNLCAQQKMLFFKEKKEMDEDQKKESPSRATGT